ncbi:restriction endonuclease [Bacillus sp. Marseille-Q3570]|uniref:restriction endonuclease n=1 Tax=Bacillus sp. Marseille-Q3570 TaxID=2963522 RepID=UPI0021B779FE|nr:restriction endonuclease [Bacillus sp. Marseille-Q3570]
MIRTPLFPRYQYTKELIRFLEDKKVSDFKSMWNSIWQLRGTPQSTVDWQDPDEWIPERLTGKDQDLALQLWIGSEKTVNPRYVRGAQMLIKNYNLIDEINDQYGLNERSYDFINNRFGPVENNIDEAEGLLFLLYLTSVNKDATRKTFLNEWTEHLLEHSNYRSESVVKDSLRRRLSNMHERGLISREGNTYNITHDGIRYLNNFKQTSTEKITDEQKIVTDIKQYNEKQKMKLKEKLHEIHPFKFENIIKDLLDAMRYEDVQVTSATNDKGVDVIGNIQNGITMVQEVIQVKRMTSNIQRPIVDQLRGSLHRFNAFQGTIITLSDFSKGTREAAFERGAAPITLINGEKLIDLLFENEILVKKKVASYYEIEEELFIEQDEENEEINE